MDIAYDHILESNFEDKSESQNRQNQPAAPQASLNEDLQDAYRAFSNSPWGARIGGFFGSVVKQVCVSLSRVVNLGIARLTVFVPRVRLSIMKPSKSSPP